MTGKTISLEATLDLGAARRLLNEVRGTLGHQLEIDASQVERIGGLCLQVLLAAKAAWHADQTGFRILNPSESFLDGMNLMAAGALLTAGEAV